MSSRLVCCRGAGCPLSSLPRGPCCPSPPHPQSGAPALLRPHIPWCAPQGYRAPHTHHWLPLALGASDRGRPTAAWKPHPSLLPRLLAPGAPRSCSSDPLRRPPRVRLPPRLDLRLGSSPPSASPSAPRSGICTETLGGWSPRTGHAQKPGLALVSSRKLLHSGGSGDFGES